MYYPLIPIYLTMEMPNKIFSQICNCVMIFDFINTYTKINYTSLSQALSRKYDLTIYCLLILNLIITRETRLFYQSSFSRVMRSKHALWNNILYDESISSKMTATTYHGSPTIRGPRTTRIGPQTPLRSQISSYGSPSVLRAEEDCVVIELGSRFLRVGLAGYAAPQTLIDFGLEQQRRAGDLRRWSSGYDNSRRSDLRTKGWAEMNELYRPDIRNLDLGLVGDKIERAVRNALTKSVGDAAFLFTFHN